MDIIAMAARNRERLLTQMEDGLLLLRAPAEVKRNADINYRFRQHGNFYFLSGLSEPNVLLALEKRGKRFRYTLFVHPHDRKLEVWIGPRLHRDDARKIYGARVAHLLKDFKTKLPQLLRDQPRLYLDLQEGSEFSAEILKTLGRLHEINREGVRYPQTIINAASLLTELRLRKEPEEVVLLKQAAKITATAFNRALRALRSGMPEYELQALLEGEFHRAGGTWAYESIVAGGLNGLVLHYIQNRDTLREGELVLIDAGAEYRNYAADVTRTWPVSGRFSPAQKQIYQAVLRAQKAAIAVIKPGATYQDVDKTATGVLVEELLRLKILKGDPGEIIRRRRHAPFYPHGVGHWLGLDTHDAGLIKPGGEDRKLEPGMVLTVEPGLYFQPDRRQTPARWRGIAVRIEDDVLVTPRGHQVLTAAIPKEIEEIETILARRRKHQEARQTGSRRQAGNRRR